MRLTAEEIVYLTALAREQAQTGCRGRAHDLLRENVFSEAPRSGKGSLAYSYAVGPLVNLLLRDFHELEELDRFLRQGPISANPGWPWHSAKEFHSRLEEARKESLNQENVETSHRPHVSSA